MTERMSERRLYSITVPGLPPSLNKWKRMSWPAQERARRNWQAMVCALLRQPGNVRPVMERVRIRAVLTFPTKRRRDSDNYGTPLNKWTQDALVMDGMIPDDTHDRCTFMPPVLMTGDCAHTFLTFEDLGVME
jgi:Holliday junction resolvase RusA-like endonuclease